MDKKKFSKENLLKTILKRRQTFKTLTFTFGYIPNLSEILKELEREGKIKIVSGFEDGQRLFFVKPSYNQPIKEKEFKSSVKGYFQKKGVLIK